MSVNIDLDPAKIILALKYMYAESSALAWAIVILSVLVIILVIYSAHLNCNIRNNRKIEKNSYKKIKRRKK